MLHSLTNRQQEVLDDMKRFHAAHGYMPTVRELAAVSGGVQINAIYEVLQALEKKGVLTLGGGLSRAMRFTAVEPKGIPFFPSLRALSDALQA